MHALALVAMLDSADLHTHAHTCTRIHANHMQVYTRAGELAYMQSCKRADSVQARRPHRIFHLWMTFLVMHENQTLSVY